MVPPSVSINVNDLNKLFVKLRFFYTINQILHLVLEKEVYAPRSPFMTNALILNGCLLLSRKGNNQ